MTGIELVSQLAGLIEERLRHEDLGDAYCVFAVFEHGWVPRLVVGDAGKLADCQRFGLSPWHPFEPRYAQPAREFSLRPEDLGPAHVAPENRDAFAAALCQRLNVTGRARFVAWSPTSDATALRRASLPPRV